MRRIIFFTISLLSFLLVSTGYTYEGDVVVLRAPTFSRPDIKSKITQYYSKGESLYIYSENDQAVIEKNGDQDFYITLDNLGNKSYILTKFVRIRYLDKRELSYQAPKGDPTDYRIIEPLIPQYPFFSQEKYRGFVTTGMGAGNHINYPYNAHIVKESRGNKFEVNTAYAYNAKFDKNNRFYFGGQMSFATFSNQFLMVNGPLPFAANEDWMRIGIGPYVSYDLLNYNNIRMILDGGFLYSQIRDSITVARPGLSTEERTFSTYSITPKLGAMLMFENVFPQINFITGISMQYQLYEVMSSSDVPEKISCWSITSDNIQNVSYVDSTAYIGLLFK